LLLFVLACPMSNVAHADASAIATASINLSPPGSTIPPTFIGFSHEWSAGPTLMGSRASGTNPIYRQLVENLLAYGAGPMVIRIGGNSTDATGAPQPGVLDPYAQLATDLGARFILGVNLGAGDVSLASDQANAYVRGMPADSLVAIEIGNEPDLYHSNGHRPPDYGFPDFAHDFATWRDAIRPYLTPGLKLMGPSWASASQLPHLPAFLDQEAPNLALVSQHWYAGTQCNGKTNPPEYLLGNPAATSGARAVASSVALTHERGLPFRIGEMNSISCGGEVGVSDVFASALWAVDALFEYAQVGVDGVNIHNGNGGGYALFAFDATNEDDGTNFTLRSIRPEYYGLLLFQQAAVAGSRLVPVTLSTATNVKVWATEDDSGTVRVAVLNKDEQASGAVSIHLPGYGPASVTRLLAPGLGAQNGITLGGQTFDASVDGTPQGAPVSQTVTPQADTYAVSVPPVSAALCVIPSRQTALGS
jgi:Glycosyl hydrolase family 79 C-terminal beta domain